MIATVPVGKGVTLPFINLDHLGQLRCFSLVALGDPWLLGAVHRDFLLWHKDQSWRQLPPGFRHCRGNAYPYSIYIIMQLIHVACQGRDA
jgi:hypothetical protein